MRPQKVLYDVRAFMGPEDVLLSDVGAHKMWIARYYQCDEPNTCLISNGFCTMGFAFPGSIGAKIAMPERRILSINGDAGFFMNAQDIETAVRRKINVVAMIWMDGAYGLIEWKQRNAFDGRHFDLSFTNPDLALWAQLLRRLGPHRRAPGRARAGAGGGLRAAGTGGDRRAHRLWREHEAVGAPRDDRVPHLIPLPFAARPPPHPGPLLPPFQIPQAPGARSASLAWGRRGEKAAHGVWL